MVGSICGFGLGYFLGRGALSGFFFCFVVSLISCLLYVTVVGYVVMLLCINGMIRARNEVLLRYEY